MTRHLFVMIVVNWKIFTLLQILSLYCESFKNDLLSLIAQICLQK